MEENIGRFIEVSIDTPGATIGLGDSVKILNNILLNTYKYNDTADINTQYKMLNNSIGQGHMDSDKAREFLQLLPDAKAKEERESMDCYSKMFKGL